MSTPGCSTGARRIEANRRSGPRSPGGAPKTSGTVAILANRGEVAQLVEHATENRGVGSSILPLATFIRSFIALGSPATGLGSATKDGETREA